MARRQRREEPDAFVCPCCGADVAVGAMACPECGASEEFGWDEGYRWDDELPEGYAGENDFDYDEFIEEEFPAHATEGRKLRRAGMILVAILTSLGILGWLFGL